MEAPPSERNGNLPENEVKPDGGILAKKGTAKKGTEVIKLA
jgi:hypothetical protein